MIRERRDLQARPPGDHTTRYQLWQAMVPGRWMRNRAIVSRCDTADWPKSRVKGIATHLHELVGDGVAVSRQLDNGEWEWKRTI